MLRCVLQKNIQFNFKRWTSIQKCQQYSSLALERDTKYRVGSQINGYTVQQIEPIPEFDLTAIQLEHRATGASHLHLACDDTNNLFSVALKTIPQNSAGAPHILEHLTLCGSQKFPCRDPFMNMLTRSLSTFMNAFTGSDYTMYVFSTENTKDFQNLLSVYLDAVFYPLLREMDFRQEGWRLEHTDINDKNSPVIFKGVVFNEMKGYFSNPDTVYGQHLINTLYPSNAYSFISGGDPLVIPSLTWEELKQYHDKYYHPSNSRFTTYGNLPLEAHLEKIESFVLQNFQKINIQNDIPDEKLWTQPKEVHIHNRFDPMAANPERQTIISNSYLLERITNSYETFTISMLGSLLISGPNSPFYQALLESGIGADYSPCTGCGGGMKQAMFSVGVRQIAEEEVEHVKEVIETTFSDVINSGFPDERLKSELHNLELRLKHRSSNFGLTCALGVNNMWNHYGNPILSLKANDHIQYFLNQMKENPVFLQDKVVQYFKNNNNKLTLIMSPAENFEVEQQLKEKKLLESKINKLSDAEKLQIFQDGRELANHQQLADVSCLPSLQIEDVKKCLEKTPIKNTYLHGVHVQLCEVPTNEMVYFRAFIDAASVPEEYVIFLPLFCDIVTRMGAGDRNNKQFHQEVKLKTGGLSASVDIIQDPDKLHDFDMGLQLSSNCLKKNATDMFSLWNDIFCRINLEDRGLLSQLIELTASDYSQGISDMGHKYSIRKANSCLNTCNDIKENLFGLSQVSFRKKLAEMKNHDEVLEKLKTLSKYLLYRKPLRCSVNATSSDMPDVLDNLYSFLSDIPADPIKSSTKKITSSQASTQKTHFVFPYPVNYIGQSILTVPFSHDSHASLEIAGRLVTCKFLLREIREKGGAYGCGADIGNGGEFSFFSYRDPNVISTLNSFSSAIEWLCSGNYSEEDLKEAKLAVFADVDSPLPPSNKGLLLFSEKITDEMLQKFREDVFKCSKDDIISASKMYLKNSSHVGFALIGPDNPLTKNATDWTLVLEQ